MLVISCVVCLAAFMYAYYYWGKAGKIQFLRDRKQELQAAQVGGWVGG